MKPLIALCIGHSRKINSRMDGGALSVDDTTEHAYNRDLAATVADILRSQGFRVNILTEYQGNGYTAAMRWLGSTLKADQTTIAVEFHFNSSENPKASGHEWLYWESSGNGERLARLFADAFRNHLPELPARGIKPCNPKSRGAEFLRLTPCPAIILEPFFGSNPQDWRIATEKKQTIATLYASALSAYFAG